jgi:serine/threonine protein kinase
MRNQLHEGVVLNGRYKTISPLNHGSFGMVFQAKDLYTGQIVAIKVITKPAAAQANDMILVDERSEELKIHLLIRSHPNVVNLLESFETDSHTYLVIEFCSNGDLYEAIRVGKGPLETEHVRDFMLQLVDAVEFIHSRGVYHRDIKPENIFLTQSGSMKLGDFGLATTDVWSYEIAVGSDRYMAPEQYDPSNAGYSTAKADIWAIGICLLNVLFSRNPFAVPNTSDPLYADFALDRQSLFDVFPNMSQDTFEVLIHCLAIDPEKRDLSLVRDALNRVVSFTTDDETLDDFCTEDREPVVPSANREPLRTPSLSTPQVDNGGSFPWAKALAMSPQQPVRQLSAIPDTEIYEDDLFPGSKPSDNKWFDVKADVAPGVSFADSGLGLSFKSTEPSLPGAMDIARSKPMAIAGSLPIRPFNSLASVFGKKRDAISKSWSDLWDEEEEELEHAGTDIENDYLPASNLEVKEERKHDSAISTERNGLSEMKNPAMANNRRSRSSKNRRAKDHVSQQTGFIFEDHTPAPPKYSPPPKRTAMDKWAALGDKRRGQQQQHQQQQQEPKQQHSPLKPAKTPMKTPKQHLITPNSARKRSRTGSWRRPSHLVVGPENHGLWRKLDWNASKDWRQHAPHEVFVDDIGDLEWVGGWNDLHL